MKRDAGKEKYWRDAIAEADGSGQSVREFCRQRGLKENLFYSWRRELRVRDSEAIGRPGFVELLRPAASNGAGVSIRVDGRIEIVVQRGFDREALKAVLACMGAASGPMGAEAAGA